MARTRTLANLRADVRERADMVGSSFVTDPTVDEFINQSLAALYDMLAGAFGDEYFNTFTTLTTTAGVDSVTLPSDFYKLTGLFWRLSSSERVPLLKYTPAQAELSAYTFGWSSGNDVFYRLAGDNVRFVPEPTGVHTLDLHYIYAPARLVDDGDTWDGYGGWEEWAIWDATIKCLVKEESDTSAAERERTRVEARIEAAADRDHAEPPRIQRKRIAGRWCP